MFCRMLCFFNAFVILLKTGKGDMVFGGRGAGVMDWIPAPLKFQFISPIPPASLARAILITPYNTTYFPENHYLCAR